MSMQAPDGHPDAFNALDDYKRRQKQNAIIVLSWLAFSVIGLIGSLVLVWLA